jgi:gas vesicle protein
MRNAVGFLVGAVIGGVLGASVALLFAPASGGELRNRMQAEADRIRSEVNRAASDRRVELEQQLAALRTPQKSG